MRPGNDGNFRGGPGMPEQPSEKEMKIISKETGKIKKILSEEQFIKWRESLHESREKNKRRCP